MEGSRSGGGEVDTIYLGSVYSYNNFQQIVVSVTRENDVTISPPDVTGRMCVTRCVNG